MKFTVIGITDTPAPFFPPDVLGIISRGKHFSGGRRHHELVSALLPADARWIDITVPLDRVFEQYQALGAEAEVIVFASGDPLFFGFANTIRERMSAAAMQVFPAFNSLQMLAHRLLMPYHDLRIVSLTGRPWPAFDRALIERTAKIGILTDRDHTPAAIARRMLDYGYDGYQMHVGEHLGNPAKERITTLTLEEAATRDFTTPNCVILSEKGKVKSEKFATAMPSAEEGTAVANFSLFTFHSSLKPFGLPDNSFALLDGRERMITKMPIRLLTLQALDLASRHVFWDIGFCTGSVSIEARLLFPHLQIEAFEIRPECEAIIRENMRRHGAPGIGIHMGDFRSVCCASRSVCCDTIATNTTIAAPDAVFIGGHGGQLKEVMATVLRYLRPGGVIVMNSVKAPRVTTDSHQLWDEACRELGLQQEAPLHIQLDDHHPITILKCRR